MIIVIIIVVMIMKKMIIIIITVMINDKGSKSNDSNSISNDKGLVMMIVTEVMTEVMLYSLKLFKK